MTLSFQTHVDGRPTYFVDKIWQALIAEYGDYPIDRKEWMQKLMDKGIIDSFVFGLAKPKIHTIREDKSDRWREGNMIHFVINNRTPNRFQFAPTILCKGVQGIEIKHYIGNVEIHIDGKCHYEVLHHGLDDIYEHTTGLESFVKNDGFDTIEDFFKWFDDDYSGKIIHWTNYRYE